mmetsp:Transcript_31981/g.38681  ORF Transcript_31981/g.38681 Transcript_31981/m.38681 type:complete len:799 (+) Transcript_31981:196-2592(+)|eukprot:CAMPEP_0197849638 /NCGR_PEP_ID=MMETSP1438-20131217/12762_1 /TAXON_ID=1461541 /ORGANISM="Pterosperma sp., Strain CCMP1384" /LENGTH=798 /DNA_ID=CAMNT_0043462417 /DNA_START=194 /DNA_END=2590 /DNA_ORIENTATION=+
MSSTSLLQHNKIFKKFHPLKKGAQASRTPITVRSDAARSENFKSLWVPRRDLLIPQSTTKQAGTFNFADNEGGSLVADLSGDASTGDLILPQGLYCPKTYQTERRKTRTCWVGKVPIGSEHPIVRQTMTTTDTSDVEATVQQTIRCADAGADLVRITVQGMREAKACQEIKNELIKRGYGDVGLVADIHFAPKVAMIVAEAFEKVRVNPGNFADGRKSMEEKTYDTKEEYLEELAYIEEVFTPLVLKCKELGTAMRIGTNHGSLSARTLGAYGDTPAGMVESAFEFARICRKHDYHNFLFSMKASNPLVMVAAYRLLAAEMYKLDWDYPLHLGVTEAGEGEDGRMKSSIGIGTLLMDGLGDTIRVSLTEDPELEMVPCGKLAGLGTKADAETMGVKEEFPETSTPRDYTTFDRRVGDLPSQQEEDSIDYRYLLHRDGSVLTHVKLEQLQAPETLYTELGCKLVVGLPFKDIATSDSILLDQLPTQDDKTARLALRRLQDANIGLIAPIEELEKNPFKYAVALVPLAEVAAHYRDCPEGLSTPFLLPEGVERMAVSATGLETPEDIALLSQSEATMIILRTPEDQSRVHTGRRFFQRLHEAGLDSIPVIHHLYFAEGATKDDIVIEGGATGGSLLVDGLGDGLMIHYGGDANNLESSGLDFLRRTSFGMLQGCRMRNTKTEFVSCPSCGRTLFDITEVQLSIAERTGHLPGVAIAVMGCIVNGPGEMADADFGYVGGAPGKIDLYVGKEVVRKAIPDDQACDELIALIKEHGRWVEPGEGGNDDEAEAKARLEAEAQRA